MVLARPLEYRMVFANDFLYLKFVEQGLQETCGGHVLSSSPNLILK